MGREAGFTCYRPTCICLVCWHHFFGISTQKWDGLHNLSVFRALLLLFWGWGKDSQRTICGNLLSLQHVDPRDQTHLNSLGSKYLNPLGHLNDLLLFALTGTSMLQNRNSQKLLLTGRNDSFLTTHKLVVCTPVLSLLRAMFLNSLFYLENTHRSRHTLNWFNYSLMDRELQLKNLYDLESHSQNF